MKINAFTKVMDRPLLVQKMLLIMKLTTLLMIITLLHANGAAFSQKINLNEKNAPIEKVLRSIKKQSGYVFFYDEKELNKVVISVSLKDATIDEALKECFKDLPITFNIVSNTVVLKSRPANNLNPDFRDVTIKGRVADEKGVPLVGATVKVKGSQTSVVTNENGDFTIKLPNYGDVLIISYVGFDPIEVKVSDDKAQNIVLKPSNVGLSEFVVVGYGTQKKINLTGAIASIDSKTLESRPLTNLGQGLQGLLPNLNISIGNGRPGTGTSFNIRGTTSINASGPLVLVDGVQMDPNQINPSDVESVTVLKDASASAIYGVRAAYGVVLITTKKGKKNTPVQISYSFDYTLTRPTKLPKTMNSVDYINAFMEANKTGALSSGETADDAFTDTDLQKAQAYINNPIPQNAVYIDPRDPRYYRYVGNTDWADALYPGYAPQMQHNISINGGNDKTTYIASLGYFNQEGILKAANQDFNRYNANVRINSDVKSWLTLNMRISLNRVDDNSPAATDIGGIERLSSDLRPVMPIKHPDGNYSGQKNFTNNFALLEYNGRSITKSNDLWLTGGFELRPLKNVKVFGDYTWNSYTWNSSENRKSFQEYGANGVALGLYPWTATPRVFESNSNDRYIALNSYATYENTFASKHYVKAMVGYNQELKQVKGFNANVKNLINQDIPSINLNSDDKPNVGGSSNEWAVSGTFFRVNYAFNDKYLLEVNARYDGTSRFARNHRYNFNPSVSAGWRISQERFFEPIKKVFNELKIRGSYGTLGNQQLGNNYPYIATMNSGIGSYIFGNQQQTSVSAPGLVSVDFTWEKVTSKNIGIDFGLLNNRLTGSFDYYIRDTKDMVAPGSPAPTVLGTGVPNRNAADLRTKGFELTLGWADKVGTDWSYNVVLGLSDYTAKITKYQNPNGLISDYYVGRSFGEIWGFETEGFYASDADAAKVDNSAIWGGKWLAGDIKYRDLNGDGKIARGNQTLANPGDLKVIGNSTPRYQFGLNASVRYKDFDLTLFMQGVGKRDLILGGNFFWGFANQYGVPTEAHVGQYWTPENTDAYFPRLRFGGGGNFQNQTKYLQSGAYLRMKQATLGYTLPQSLLSKVKINRVRLYVTGQNLFEFTSMFKNYDPEQPERTDYPLNRAVSFGIQVGL